MKRLALLAAAAITAALAGCGGGGTPARVPVQPVRTVGITAQTSQDDVRALVTDGWRRVQSPLKGFACYTQQAPFARTRSGRAWLAEVCIQITGPAS
jgi:hypothetical protein